MIDYSNVVEPLPCRVRGEQKLGRLVLALVILGVLACLHFAAVDRDPEPKKPALVEFTAAQINTMRANGRLLSERELLP